MNRIAKIFVVILIFTSCSADSNDKNSSEKLDDKMSLIIGKWKVTDGNPIVEGTIVSEYFKDNTFKQVGEITSFQPSYTCQATANGTFSISNNILSYSYLAEKMFDCKPEEYQLMVDSYMGNKALETGQNQLIQLDEKTMVQENLQTKKKLTFSRVVE